MDKLLQFDPAKRLTVEESLAHPYLEAHHDEQDEPSHESHFDFSFESINSLDKMREVIAGEIVSCVF